MGDALGVMDIRTLAGAIDAANTAVNSAPVDIAATSYALPGIVTVVVRGTVDAVAAAVHAVRGRLDPTGGVVAWTILARPDAAVEELLAQRRTPIGVRAGAPSVPGRVAARRSRAPRPARAPATEPSPPAADASSDADEAGTDPAADQPGDA